MPLAFVGIGRGMGGGVERGLDSELSDALEDGAAPPMLPFSMGENYNGIWQFLVWPKTSDILDPKELAKDLDTFAKLKKKVVITAEGWGTL